MRPEYASAIAMAQCSKMAFLPGFDIWTE